MSTSALNRRDARGQILHTAERLIAERGPDVSLREIAAAAQQRNNSAVHYHFGSRDALIEAVIEARMTVLEARRLELLAAYEAAGRGAGDVRALVELLVLPLADLRTEGVTHYCRFLEAVRSHPAVAGRERLADSGMPAVRIIVGRLDRALDLPPQTRRQRLAAMATVLFALLADLERAEPTAPDAAAQVSGIVDMLVGLLTALSARAAAVARSSEGVPHGA